VNLDRYSMNILNEFLRLSLLALALFGSCNCGTTAKIVGERFAIMACVVGKRCAGSTCCFREALAEAEEQKEGNVECFLTMHFLSAAG
jgi:hypothetical protein